MSFFEQIAKVLGGGDKHAGYGVMEGVGDTGVTLVKDADTRIEDNTSRLTELRQNRLANEEVRYNAEHTDNYEEIKALSASLGPNGTDILYGLMTENNRGYAGAKALVPAIVAKTSQDNISVDQFLNYVPKKDGQKSITAKELADIATTPMTLADINMEDALLGTGSQIIDLIAGKGAAEKYATKQVQQQMALAGFPEDFGKKELSDAVAGDVTVDKFQLSLVGSIENRIQIITTAALNATNQADKEKLYNMVNTLKTHKQNLKDTQMSESQIKSTKAAVLKEIAEGNDVLGQWDDRNQVWITKAAGQARYNQAAALSTSLVGILAQSKKMFRKDGQGVIKGWSSVIPSEIASRFNLQPNTEYSVAEMMSWAAQAGMSLKIVPADSDDNLHPTKEAYVTWGSPMNWVANNTTGSGSGSGGGGSGSSNLNTSPNVFPNANTIVGKINNVSTPPRVRIANAKMLIDQIKQNNPQISKSDLEEEWENLVGSPYNSSDWGGKSIDQL